MIIIIPSEEEMKEYKKSKEYKKNKMRWYRLNKKLTESFKNKYSGLQESISKLNDSLYSYNELSFIMTSLLEDFKNKKIDESLINGLELWEFNILIKLCEDTHMPFSAVIEDVEEFFGSFTFENANQYLEKLAERQKYLNPVNLSAFLANFNIENDELEYIMNKINSFKIGKIRLNKNKISVLKLFRNNPCVTNEFIANSLNMKQRAIEDLCSNIRTDFNLEEVGDKNSKRHLLYLLAQEFNL